VNLELLSEGKTRQDIHVGFDLGKAEAPAGLLTRIASQRPLTLAMDVNPCGVGDAMTDVEE
jgi:hypothetical protein